MCRSPFSFFMILTDVSVRKLFFEYLDRRLSVEKCLFSCLTELVGQDGIKSNWRPKRSQECRSPFSFFMILTDVSVRKLFLEYLDRRLSVEK